MSSEDRKGSFRPVGGAHRAAERDAVASAAAASRSASRAAERTGITDADYLRIYPKLAAKIRLFGIPREQVEELVQQTFLEAHRGLSEGRFQGRSALDTWAVSIAKNLCLKHYRTQKAAKRNAREVPVDALGDDVEARSRVELEAETPLPDRLAEDRELLHRALRSLQSLPAILREPLVLQVRGHSYEQIAELLEIPSNLVSSRIHQAREELRRELPRSAAPSR
jgi:RNA polymerase sigma-70 factor (ECF subfamily)